MIIGEDAKTNLGEMVLPEGTRLSKENIKTLKAWGIPEVKVLDRDDRRENSNQPSNAEPELKEKFSEEILNLFAKSNTTHPAIQELMRLSSKAQKPNKE